jgi:ABC-type glycerol-3-phosphate transport system permease component
VGVQEMARRLSGWQRLWIVFAVLYLLPVVGFTAMVFPKQSDIARTRLYDTIRAVREYREANEPDSNLSDEEVIKRLHDKWGRKVDFSQIEAEYKQKVEALPMERAKAVGIAFLVWFIPVLLIYAIGMTVAWVIRGFRRENP